MIRHALLTFAAFGLVAGSADAAPITYVDATDGVGGNTALAGGGTFEAYPEGTSDAPDWKKRPFANDGTVFESNGEGQSINASTLVTTISGLTPGESYYTYAYFWGADGWNQWRGRAALDWDPSEQLPIYNTRHNSGSSFEPMDGLYEGFDYDESPNLGLSADGNGFENSGHFANDVLITEGNRALAQVSLGQAVADANGEIAVYIDDMQTDWGGFRTWYDGVGYAVPEPGSLTLLGAGGLLLLRRRR